MPNTLFGRQSCRLFVASLLTILSGFIAPVYADLTPQVLPFAQDWSDMGLIATDDNWSSVPGIVGYRGDGLAGSTGVNPQTILGEGTAVVDVGANQANPNTFTTGGVAEFHVTNPTVALQGSGTARAPSILITLNTTGFSGILVSYTVRDVDGSADNSAQPVALQYRVGTTGNFTNLSDGFVIDGSTGPSLATLVTPVSVTLPAAADNQTVIQVRMITADAVGSDEWVGIDDIAINGAPVGNTPPSISTQPVAQTVTAGSPAQFTVAAGGSAPLSYQWRKGGVNLEDGGNLSGALTSTLALSAAQLADAGGYDVIVTNSFGSVQSDLATLTVNPPPTPPSITTDPASQTVNEGTTVQFTVEASGTAPLSYQWRKGETNLSDAGIVSGATTNTLTLSGVQLSDAGNYDVVVTNSSGGDTSAVAVLTVNVAPHAPAIVTHPAPQTVVTGGIASFTVEASGTAPLTFQWRKSGVDLVNGGVISGANTATLTLSGVSAIDAGSYDVVVSNAINPPAISNSAALIVSPLITPAGNISYVGGTYNQDFNTLPASGTFTLVGTGPFAFSSAPINASGLGGWSFAKYAGSGANALFVVNSGGSTSGSIFSYGTGATTDRALGSLSSGSTVSRAGVTLVNDTGQTITEFTLGYTGEQWRRGGSGNVNTLTFQYAVSGIDLNNGTFAGAPALNFASVNTTGGGAALDGNFTGTPPDVSNRAPVSATVSGITWEPGQTLVLRWTDIDDTGSDDGLAIDDLTFSTPVTPADVIPAVAFTTPASGAVNVPTNTAISVTFNSAVNLTGSWFALSGAMSGVHTATVTGGPTSYTLTPATSFAEGELITLTIFAAGVSDLATGLKHPGADATANFFTFSSGPLPINVIQGNGGVSAFANHSVTVQGIVIASFQGTDGIGGYYIQEPDALQDGNPATSEGVYVFDNVNSVAEGDLVTITGTVFEYGSAPNSQTEIKDITAFAKHSAGNPLPTATAVTLPFPTIGYIERYEGMRVTLPQTLTVTDNYDYGIFGEVVLSNGRLSVPTNIVAPGAPAQAQAAANQLNQLLLDDGVSTQHPDPTPFLLGSDPASMTLRAGSTISGIVGVLDNRFGTYVLEPIFVPTFVDANPRGPLSAANGRLKVAISNVLNFFNGDGAGGGFPTSRGASNEAEYQRQRAKLIAGLTELEADIIGLTEVENDGFGPLSAVADIVNGLNAAAPAGTTYAYVDGSAVEITTDVIHVAFVYRTETVEMVGGPAMLSHAAFNNLARNPLAQSFREKATGEKLTVCVNHFRAKGSVAAGAGNPDSGDGQGNNNALRVQQSNALTAWLATDPTGSGDPDFLIIGDLNAYAKEDPIVAIENAGYVNLTEQFEGAAGYSYSFNGEFGHLDHALANGALAPQVAGAATWHVNSDEPIYYDYNTEDKSAAQQAINVGTPYRYADHDPVVVGINLTSPAAIITQPTSQATSAGSSVTFSVTATGTPPPTYQWRKDGVEIEGATSASYTIASVVVADSGNYDVVVTNSTGSVVSTTVSLLVSPASASVTLSNLEQRYDGTPRTVTATTTPAGKAVSITYAGSASAPIYPGVYEVVATITDPNYTGSVSDVLVITTTALVRHAPMVNGKINGSVQVLLPEATTLNSSASISGDLLMPGTPKLILNGKSTYGGTIDASGSATPSNYNVTLNSAALRHLVRRVNAIVMPTVSAPPMPAGNRNVTLNNASQSPGDFATLRNLTLNSTVGTVAVPPGTYGTFIVNSGSALRFGIAGGTSPSAYNLQGATINSNAKVEIVGPIILTVANGVTLNGSMGNAAHPEWLELNVASGGVTLNSNVTLSGAVVAPSGAITINGGSTVNGGVVSDRLTLNTNATVK